MSGFSTGLSALSAARLGISVVGNNIANASTPGYSRQRVLLASRPSALLGGRLAGGGVQVTGLERISDGILLQRLYSQQHELGRASAQLASGTELQRAYGEPGEGGLGATFASYFDRLSALSTSPGDLALRREYVSGAEDLAARLQRVQADLTEISSSGRVGVQGTVDEVNRITEALAGVNRELGGFVSTTTAPPAELLDRQGSLLEELAVLSEFSLVQQSGGRVDVRIGGHVVVGFDRARPLELGTDSDGAAAVFVEDGGAPVDLRGGRLAGLLESVGSTENAGLAELDALARALIRETNRLHATGVPEGGGHLSLEGSRAFGGPTTPAPAALRLDELPGPFAVNEGSLRVSIVNEGNGSVSVHELPIRPAGQTLGEFVGALDAIDGLGAQLDASGRVRLSADSGMRFHFGAELSENPAGGNASVVHPGDSSDILVALGLGGVFVGEGASDIAVASKVSADPTSIAAGLSGAASDDDNLIRMLALRDGGLEEFDGKSIEEQYRDRIGLVGSQAKRADSGSRNRAAPPRRGAQPSRTASWGVDR